MNRINQPDRISIDSFADTTTATDGQFFTFTNTSPNTTLVGAKKIHVLQATVPYICPPLPNYQLVVYYYKMPNAATAPAANYLQAVRLYPSDYIPPTGFTAYTQNANFQTPQELVDALNEAATTGGDNATYNTLWTVNDVNFTYDPTTNKIAMFGLDTNSFYCMAGYNDPIVLASQFSSAITTYNQDTTTSRQLQTPGFTLNLRLGFAMDGVSRPRGSGTNFLSNKCANLTGKSYAGAIDIIADTYPDLNYTSNVYVYSNIVGNSGYGSVNKKNLLCVIPIDVPLGGVAQFIGHSTPAYATKVASEIYSVDIELRDDANMPFFLPDSANCHIDIGILYE